MDLSKFGPKGKRSGLGETGVYLLNVISSLYDELESLIYARTKQFVVASDYYTTVGGSAVEEILLKKACGVKKVFVTTVTPGAVPVTIISARCDYGKIIITFSADPGNDHIINYLLVR